MKVEKKNLKIIFAEIINGYSSVYLDSFEGLRIKHLTNLDSSNIDLIRDRHFKKAENDGLPTESSRLDELDKEKAWTHEDDRFLSTQESYLRNLEHTRSKLFLEKDIREVQKKLEEGEKIVLEKSNKKKDLIGFTAEDYAHKKVDDYYFHFSLRNEKGELYFTKEQIDELDSDHINKIKLEYNNKMESFKSLNIKRISVSPFFLNFYLLSDGNPQVFYGKPIIDLTYFQAEILSHAKKYRNLIENAKVSPPDYLYENPDELMGYLESTMGLNPAEDERSQGKDATTIVGATKADMKKMGVEKPRKSQDMAAQAAAKGGSLNMQDLMKMHGVK